MTDAIEVVAVGSRVRVGDLEAAVHEVSVGSRGRVQYRVVYFDGRTRNSVWVESWEVKRVEGGGTARIGFNGTGGG